MLLTNEHNIDMNWYEGYLFKMACITNFPVLPIDYILEQVIKANYQVFLLMHL